MQVTTISYEQLHSFGSYQNERYALTAVLEQGEDVNAAYSNLRQIVATQIAVAEEEREAEQERVYQEARAAHEAREAEREAEWLASHPGKTEADYERVLDDPFLDE